MTELHLDKTDMSKNIESLKKSIFDKKQKSNTGQRELSQKTEFNYIFIMKVVLFITLNSVIFIIIYVNKFKY